MATKASVEDVTKRLQKLAATATEQQARLIEQYGELYRRFLGGEIVLDPAKDTRFWADEVGRYFQTITEMNLNYYMSVLDFGREFADRLANEMKRSAASPPRVTRAKATTKRRSSKGRASADRTA